MSKPLTGFRVAVLATDGVEEAELTKPVKALKDAGAKVTLVSLKPGEIQAVRHDLDKTVKVTVDRTIGDINADEFDAVHLPGGTVNADRMRVVLDAQSLLRAMQDDGEQMEAASDAARELVDSGLLLGRTRTNDHTIQAFIRNLVGD